MGTVLPSVQHLCPRRWPRRPNIDTRRAAGQHTAMMIIIIIVSVVVLTLTIVASEDRAVGLQLLLS